MIADLADEVRQKKREGDRGRNPIPLRCKFATMMGEDPSHRTANPNKSVECLFSSPRPASTPKHSQSREFPVRTICAGTRMQRVQNSGLKVWVDGTVQAAWGQELL